MTWHNMNWYKKKVALILSMIMILFTVGGTHVSAISMVPTNLTDYDFYPILEEIRVNDDGSLSGTALVEHDFQVVTLVIDDYKGNRKNEIYLQGGLDLNRDGVTTSVTPLDYKILNRLGESTYIYVDSIDFHISAKKLDLSPGEYTVQLKARTSLAITTHVTKETGSEKQVIVFPENKVVTVSFPGEVNVTKDGGIQITIQQTSDYAKAKFYLVILDRNEKEVKRISFNPKSPKISSKDLSLPIGEYIIFIELVDKNETLRSNVITITIGGSTGNGTIVGTGTDAGTAGQGGPTGTGAPGTGQGSPVGGGAGAGTGSGNPSGAGTIPGGKNFPGSVVVSNDGTIQIVLTIAPEYEKARFTLLIINEQEKVVKRIPINMNSPKISTKGLSLPSGSYTIVIEMAHAGEKYLSIPVNWEVPVQESTTVVFPIPSGQSFPGGVTVNPNGTITITLEWKEAYSDYQVYLIVYDLYGNVVKRVPVDLKKPNLSIKELNLSTGGYTVVIEIVDPGSGNSASSIPVFITVNETSGIIIFIDGQVQTLPMAPVKIDNRILVPMRAIFEAFGAKVDWDDATQTVTATKDNNVIKLTIGSKVAFKNGQPIPLDVPAILYNGNTTMVPIRFVSEALGAKVEWDGASNSVIISN